MNDTSTIEKGTDSGCSAQIERYQEYFSELFRGNFFKCLNDETRQKIMLLVGQHAGDGLRVADIARNFDLDRTTISHHLAMLRDGGLLNVARRGKERYYALNSVYIIETLEEVISIFKACRDVCEAGAGSDSKN
jgi:DNA-binding transcriptional ArsR family regulator